MRHFIILLIILSSLSCNKKVENTSTALKTTSVKDSKTVEGIVKSIEYGKDGFVAKILTAENEIYFVLISHVNLKDPKSYKTTNIDQKLKVSGEFWKMGEDNQITVREIL